MIPRASEMRDLERVSECENAWEKERRKIERESIFRIELKKYEKKIINFIFVFILQQKKPEPYG